MKKKYTYLHVNVYLYDMSNFNFLLQKRVPLFHTQNQFNSFNIYNQYHILIPNDKIGL